MVADFGAAVEGIGNVRDEGAGLRADLAALDAEAAVDAVRAVAVGAGEDGDRATDGDRDVERCAALDESVADAAHRVRTIGVAVRMAPGIVGRPGNRHLQFELLVVRANDLRRSMGQSAPTPSRV